jgi:hypothetical protein
MSKYKDDHRINYLCLILWPKMLNLLNNYKLSAIDFKQFDNICIFVLKLALNVRPPTLFKSKIAEVQDPHQEMYKLILAVIRGKIQTDKQIQT